MPKRTSDFRQDLLADLTDPEEAAHYINAALAESEQMGLVALRDVAEAKGMAKVAKEAGVAREAPYRMLSGVGNPTYGNLSAILKSLGLAIEVRPITTARLVQAPPARQSLGSKQRRSHRGVIPYKRTSKRSHTSNFFPGRYDSAYIRRIEHSTNKGMLDSSSAEKKHQAA